MKLPFLLISTLILTTAPLLRGAVVTTMIPEEPVFGPHGNLDSYAVDLDGDGVWELEFESLWNDFDANIADHVLVAAIDYLYTNDVGLKSYPYFPGEWIGPEALFGDWLTDPYGAHLSNHSRLGAVGYWPGQIGFFGVKFQIDADWHYGWVYIDNQFATGGGYILGYAYETIPNTPIMAPLDLPVPNRLPPGAIPIDQIPRDPVVPELSTIAYLLLGGGILSLLLLRRKR